MRTEWTARTVTDVVGTVVLDDESTARVALEDWLHDYYEADVEIAAEYLYAAAYEN